MAVTIVVTESHAAIRTMISAFLNQLRDIYVVGEAGDGINGLKCIKELKPSILFTDIIIPEISGVEFVSQAVTLSPTLRTIVFTSHTDPALFKLALKAGVSGYLLKQSLPDEIGLAIQTVLAGRTYVTPEMNSIEGMQHEKMPLSYRYATLTPRQRQIMHGIAEGKSSKQISHALNLSPKTVDHHRTDLMRHLGAHCVADLVRMALRMHLID